MSGFEVEWVGTDQMTKLIRERVDLVSKAAKRLAEDPWRPKRLHEFRQEAAVLDALVESVAWAFPPRKIARLHAMTASLVCGTGRFRDADVVRKRLRGMKREEGAREVSGRASRDRVEILERIIDVMETRRSKGRVKAIERATNRVKARNLKRPIDAILSDRPPGLAGDPLQATLTRLAWRLSRGLSMEATAHDHHALRLEFKALRDILRAASTPPVPILTGVDELGSEAYEITALLGRFTDARVLQGVLEMHSGIGPMGPAGISAVTPVTGFIQQLHQEGEDALREFREGWARRRWPAVAAAIDARMAWVPLGDTSTPPDGSLPPVVAQ
ncbi:MAG: CHAD domain-containing protein [Thermoplasmatota archaeon]